MNKKIISLVCSFGLLLFCLKGSFADTLSLVTKEISSLNLSSAQKQQIKEIQAERKSKINSLIIEHNQKKEELNQLLTRNDSDQILIDRLKSEIRILQSRISQERVKSWMEVKALLTQEQKDQLKTLSFQN